MIGLKCWEKPFANLIKAFTPGIHRYSNALRLKPALLNINHRLFLILPTSLRGMAAACCGEVDSLTHAVAALVCRQIYLVVPPFVFTLSLQYMCEVVESHALSKFQHCSTSLMTSLVRNLFPWQAFSFGPRVAAYFRAYLKDVTRNWVTHT